MKIRFLYLEVISNKIPLGWVARRNVLYLMSIKHQSTLLLGLLAIAAEVFLLKEVLQRLFL